MSYANAVIGLTNALCNHCAPIYYWQTLNYWPRCQFSNECKQKCDVSLDFYFQCKCFSQWCRCEMFMWCKCPMQWCMCKVYPWWCQRTYLTVMQTSPCRDVDAKCLVVQMPSNGHVMMQMLLVGMSWCKCPFSACHNANVHLWVCHDANVHVGMSWCKCSCRYVMM